MAINFHKVQNTMIHAKTKKKKAQSTQSPAASALFLTPGRLSHHFTHIKAPLWEGIDTGRSKVSSHSCQHPLFIYPVILSIVDPVTGSESGRCGATGTPESPVSQCWETRACDLSHTHVCVSTALEQSLCMYSPSAVGEHNSYTAND